jgi:hypothetical protein
MTKEALKLALEALDVVKLQYTQNRHVNEAIAAIKEALAQPAHCQCTACKDGVIHASDCAVHNGPAYPAGPCDCGAMNDRQRLEAIVSVVCKYLPPNGIHINEAMSEIISLVDPLPPQPAQRQWVGLTAEEIASIFSNEYTLQIAEKLLKEQNT